MERNGADVAVSDDLGPSVPSSGVFFSASTEQPLNGPSMDLNADLLSQPLCELATTQIRLATMQIPDPLRRLRRQLQGTWSPDLPVGQSRNATLLKGGQNRIVGL